MIFIIIALIIFGIILSLAYGVNSPKMTNRGTNPPRKYQYFTTFLLSILAVFIGAFLALHISDLQTRNREKDYLIDLLLRTSTELQDESITITMLYDYYNSKSIDEAERRMNGNPVKDVFSLYILINSQEFSKYITPGDCMLIQQFIRQKEKIREFMNNPDYELDDRINAYETYSKHLDDIRLMLTLESDFIEGKITYKDLLDSLSESNYINNDELPGYFGEREYGMDIPLPRNK